MDRVPAFLRERLLQLHRGAIVGDRVSEELTDERRGELAIEVLKVSADRSHDFTHGGVASALEPVGPSPLP